MEKTIFLVEDDEYIRDGLVSVLTGEGYRVTACGSLAAARAALSRPDAAPDLLILDVLLPDGSGFSLCTEVRKTRRVPSCSSPAATRRWIPCGAWTAAGTITSLSPSGSESSCPASAPSCAGRTPPLPSGCKSGNLSWTAPGGRFPGGGEVLALTPTEFHILYRLAAGQGRILTAGSCWMPCGISTANSLRTIPCRCICPACGTKLGADGARIETVRGEGYRLL